MSNLNYTVSSGNVFEGMGHNASAAMKIKADAVMILSKTITASGMTQTQAAAKLGIDQPKVSKILRGQFKSLSLDKIFSYLTALDKDINITVTEKTDDTAHMNMYLSGS
ncbi:MAG: XRE family transcriptional regulator [Ectothiorhodospiraceae bacterium]|nr:XRE family transcriptional regulator [Ectothiorhodospiraceae bacterium]